MHPSAIDVEIWPMCFMYVLSFFPFNCLQVTDIPESCDYQDDLETDPLQLSSLMKKLQKEVSNHFVVFSFFVIYKWLRMCRFDVFSFIIQL